MSAAHDDIDIKALLAVALDDDPPQDLARRVMARLAGIKTVVEFGRLIGVAPLDWLNSDEDKTDVGDDDES